MQNWILLLMIISICLNLFLFYACGLHYSRATRRYLRLQRYRRATALRIHSLGTMISAQEKILRFNMTGNKLKSIVANGVRYVPEGEACARSGQMHDADLSFFDEHPEIGGES